MTPRKPVTAMACRCALVPSYRKVARESQRPGLVSKTRAPVTNIAIPLVAGLAKGLHSLEPGLWAALNQKRWGRSWVRLCHPLTANQIGRASCRERVCQYV